MSTFEHRFWLACLAISAFIAGFSTGGLVYTLMGN